MYFSEEKIAPSSTAEFGKISRVFTKEVLFHLGSNDWEHLALESVLEGEKVSIDNLWRASEIVVDLSNDLPDKERHLLMFGKLLWTGLLGERRKLWYRRTVKIPVRNFILST